MKRMVVACGALGALVAVALAGGAGSGTGSGAEAGAVPPGSRGDGAAGGGGAPGGPGPSDFVYSHARGWLAFGRTATHAATAGRPARALSQVAWSAPMDLDPQYTGSILYIHFGSPLATPSNTIVFPVKTGAFDGFRVEGRRGANGSLLWSMDTDYSLPVHGWVPQLGIVITPTMQVLAPAAGGTILRRASADAPTAAVVRQAFFGIGAYAADPGAYNGNVKINTPISVGADGSAYFGFVVTGPTPVPLQSGIARIDPAGNGTWVAASAAAGDPSILQVVHNCAPALSADGSVLYFSVRDALSHGYLLAVHSGTLATVGSVRLKDPKTGADAHLFDDGTASPTIGPDGDVYYGVLENPFPSNHYRGWMLHYNGALTQAKLPGAFGWDDTASIVPASAVPSYTGPSGYLLFTKYNNYAQGGGDGVNKVAVLDPGTPMLDPVSGVMVMDEVLTIASVTPDPVNTGPNSPNAVKEWCINTGAVDPFTRCAFIGNEDGKLYRWDFTTNTLSQIIVLTSQLGQAYTPTIIGPDGTVYAIHDATLFAVR